MISSAAMTGSTRLHRWNVPESLVLSGKGRTWRGSRRTDEVKPRVMRQTLVALLNIYFDCCHCRRANEIFNGPSILAFEGDPVEFVVKAFRATHEIMLSTNPSLEQRGAIYRMCMSHFLLRRKAHAQPAVAHAVVSSGDAGGR
ncbi:MULTISPECIES: hypothetical protein [unclassified Burkholderia]|uniref:hypothetical protein n=1 Tax=unclassified Burkholderia TaxID=2613784 RepID=UPI0014232FF9|nr:MULTISPECIES: hypothetical protein [unclassified Burkholderia]NIE57700.1 hypothetical protein [Burkholderia sp. Ap-955]NIF10036.1 hypothetical protein [Burkholderia sp. Ax-1735]NIG03370.1 hypothetical protein [Burkholderia sp. Tr-849]